MTQAIKIQATVALLLIAIAPQAKSRMDDTQPCIRYRTTDLANRENYSALENSNIKQGNKNTDVTRISGLGVDETEHFLKCLKEKINNKEDLSDMVKYPVRTRIGAIKNKKEFISRYNSIVNQKIIDAVQNQDFDNLITRSVGVGLSAGEVWFTGFTTKDGRPLPIKIITIN